MSQILEISREGRVLRLALNRPEKRNALNAQLCRDLVGALVDGAADSGVGAILLCANGKHFSAGMDLAEVSVATADEISEVQEQLFTIGAGLAKPLLAAVSGAALGGGLGLAGNCHIVVAHSEATFGLTEIRVGLWPFLVFRALAAGLGERRVTELALTGRVFGAEEARAMGLVHEVAANAEARALEIASALASSSATAIQSGLQFVHESRGKDWKRAGEMARRMRDEVFAGSDFQEGQRAFREKRAPHWPSIRQESH
jgi:enoyl-CoA hydratase/carnithine racemase